MQPPKEKIDFKKKLADVPHKPGVYLHRDRFARVIYVGKARDLRRRLAQYFTPSRQMRADRKTVALLDAVYDFDWHTVGSEAEALLLEGKLIKEYRPRYNVSFRDDKRFLLVKVDALAEWPRFRLTRLKTGEEGCRYFGPFAHSGALRQTMNFMRKKFGVLTFGRGSPTERELRSSTYQVPMKLADITAEEYRARVALACEFMEGKSKVLLEELELEMRAVAAKLDFEKAAELRNMLEDLRQTTKPMIRYTTTMRHRLKLPSSIDPAADIVELGEALSLIGPPRRMECFDISNISTTHVVASMVCFIDGRPATHLYRRYRIKTLEGRQDDFAAMAEVVRRRYSRVLREVAAQVARCAGPERDDRTHVDYDADFSQERLRDSVRRVENLDADPTTPRLPDLIIVDGGKGQLSSACAELQALGLFDDVPIVGLAKEREEIFRPGNPIPVVLPHETGALKLMQRIRDEAHRWANGYHQMLMKRRVSESVLDECPGVSEARKQTLLKQFGSVSRLRRATVAEIASVPGFSTRSAEAIRQFLRTR